MDTDQVRIVAAAGRWPGRGGSIPGRTFIGDRNRTQNSATRTLGIKIYRGTRPKPAHLKVLEGNPGKRKIPTNEVRPKCDACPEAPSFLAGLARGEWDRIAPQCFIMGLLTGLDVMPLAAYCQAYGRWVTAELRAAEMAELDDLTSGLMIKTSNNNVIQNPVIGVARRAAADMVRYAAEFGPARAHLALIPQAPKPRF